MMINRSFLIPFVLFISVVLIPAAGYPAAGTTDNIRLDNFYNGFLGVTGQEFALRGELVYIGAGMFNSIYMNWQIQGEEEINTTFFEYLGINPYIPFYYNSHIPFIPQQQGEYNLKIWFTGLNGQDEDIAASDTIIIDLQIHDYLPQRELTLLESFSSINCGSCALISPVLTSMVKNNIEHYAMIYYHPLPYEESPLNLFNQKDQATRKDFYQVMYTPVSAVGSLYFGGSEILEENHLIMEREKPAAFTLEGSWYIQEGELVAQVSSECFASLAERNLRLLIVVVEDSVSFDTAPGSNGEKDYFFVMRAFLPDANGTFLYGQIPGQMESVQYSYFIDQQVIDEDQLGVIAFVQDAESLDIHQVIRLTYNIPDDPTGVDMLAQNSPDINVFPNPSAGRFFIRAGNSEIQQVKIFDLGGKMVFNHFYPGEFQIDLNTAYLPAGMYILQVQTSERVHQQKIFNTK